MAYLAWQSAAIAPTLTVIVKATFELVAGGPCRLAEAQAPPLPYTLNDVDALEPSVRHPSDFALAKPRAEVLLAGTAHAPSAAPLQALAVGFSVGAVAKQLTVIGDRQWVATASGYQASAPQPFAAMPLSLERCFGGAGYQANPLGVGVAADAEGRWPLPNIEHESARIVSAEDRPHPASAFPTPPTFQSRIALAGSYDDAWLEQHWPALPADFDFAYFNEAPLDQQLAQGCFRGDERIVLDHLHPQHTRLISDLPGLQPRCVLGLGGSGSGSGAGDSAAAPTELTLGLDTITIDSDLAQVFCVWRAVAQLPALELAEHAWLYVADGRIDVPQGETAELFASAERALAALADDGDGGDEQPPEIALPPPVLPDGSTLGEAPSVEREPTLARIGRGELMFGVDLSGVDLSEADLAGANLAGAILAGAKLDGAKLDGAALDGVVLAGASLRGASLVGAQLSEADLCEADLSGANLAGAKLAGADLQRSNCQGARFAAEGGADLGGTDLSGADLSAAELGGADLSGADLSGVDLSEADLSETKLEGAKLVGAQLDGASLERASCAAADLSGASASGLKASGAALQMAKLDQLAGVGALFRGAQLDGASFVGATLDRADLSGASAVGAQLVGCRLRGARLLQTKLAEASLAGSDLFEALLEAADLSGANLRGASFYSAELLQAQLDGAQLDGADLRRTKLEGRSA